MGEVRGEAEGVVQELRFYYHSFRCLFLHGQGFPLSPAGIEAR